MPAQTYFSNPMFNATLPGDVEEKIRSYQDSRLVPQLRYCYEQSRFYRKKFDDLGVKPEDIKTMEALRGMPVLMTKEDERQSVTESLEHCGHPFGMHLCAPVDQIFLTGTTSGTTGIPTFTYTFTYNDIELISTGLAHRLTFNGVGRGDRVLFVFALGIYATTMSLWGIRKIGALPIDIDSRAGSELVLRIAALARPTYMMTTNSLAEYLINKAPSIIGKNVAELGLKGLFLTGEIGIRNPEVKEKLENAYCCPTYDYWAPAGHAIGISCKSKEYQGLHGISPDLCTSFDDLVDPKTKKPVSIEDGAIGEMVITSLKREASPLIKYAYGDVVQVFTKPCPSCGFPGKRIKILGRSDDMLIVKGVNVYPVAIRSVVNSFIPNVTGEMRIVLNTPPPKIIPPVTLRIEHGEKIGDADLPGLGEMIASALHDQLKIRPTIEWVRPGTFVKSTHKTPIFIKMYEDKQAG